VDCLEFLFFSLEEFFFKEIVVSLALRSPPGRRRADFSRFLPASNRPKNQNLAPLGRHFAPLVHHLGANMSENARKNEIFEPTLPKVSRKMPQSTLPTTPKVQKTYKTMTFFEVFCYPVHVPKSLQNGPKTAPRLPKLSSNWPSWRHLGSTWRYHSPAWAQLAANLAHLALIFAPTSRKVSSKSHPKSQETPQDPPRPCQTTIFLDFRPLQATIFIDFLSLQASFF